ncbi:hypothetical protein Pan216_38990 [Planctomycetes bacterium Pan216]|uniref:Uncharacterized protein n=1 Tax=Kolteria novifilia TaxID=2527975 RepID=A0A518B7S5_9BACT|nr:hypothetical protein Pan216_38990 [Planctomycetes bacterium Pan216]
MLRRLPLTRPKCPYHPDGFCCHAMMDESGQCPCQDDDEVVHPIECTYLVKPEDWLPFDRSARDERPPATE